MIHKTGYYNATRFCCEDISLIENYNKAMADDSDTVWVCHHRKEIELNKSGEELKEMGLYWNRPANELIFLTRAEHASIHHKDKKRSIETRNKISKGNTGKKLTPEQRKKISITTKNAMKNPEVRNKISIGLTGKTPGNKGKKTPHKKYLWQTPDGKIKTMNKRNAEYYHPDWTLIGEINEEQGS